jgi:hypothetical protein
MPLIDRDAKRQELDRLHAAVRQLEAELASESAGSQWPPPSYYTAYHVLAGFTLGIFGACTSLLFNMVGSLVVGQHPLQLIRVYLTFPLGASALQIDNGLVLAVGCCLYLATGMVLGIPFQIVLSRWLAGASFATRILCVSGLALVLWLVNYYAILAWLQPLLFGGRWIITDIPWPVAALTHLIFGWTMLLVYPLGAFVPYQHRRINA